MASLLSPRPRTGVWLRVTEPRGGPGGDPGSAATSSPLRWPIAAILSGLGTALVGWVLVAGVVVLGWVTSEPGTLSQALGVGTVLWLLANGAGVGLGGLTVSLVPWGATAVFAYVVWRSARLSGRLGRADSRATPARVAALHIGSYLAVVGSAAALLSIRVEAGRGTLAVPLALGVVGVWGAARGLGCPILPGPAWLRGVARGVVAAGLVVGAGGAGALLWSLVDHWPRLVELSSVLDPGLVGGAVLVLAQLAFAPNAVAWAASYVLGGGLTLGAGTLVAPASVELGTLPSLPLLAGLPDPGPGSTATLGWLVVGALAGGAAAIPPVRFRPQDGVVTTALVGGFAAVVAALAITGAIWATGGDLGAARLAGVGPRWLPVLVLAGSTLGLAGIVTGLAIGLRRRYRRRRTR